jgi:glycine/D-amino acid oxidase-like deaminating enzyme
VTHIRNPGCSPSTRSSSRATTWSSSEKPAATAWPPAYYLAKDHGITNVCVLEKGYIGGGNTGRNTTIIRSNYLTPEGVKFYDESVKLWQDLSTDFDLNLFYANRGHFTLAHTDSALRTMRWRAEVNKHYGIAPKWSARKW